MSSKGWFLQDNAPYLQWNPQSKAPLRSGGSGDLYLKNVSSTLLSRCHEELRPSWRQRGSKPLLARCGDITVSMVKPFWNFSVTELHYSLGCLIYSPDKDAQYQHYEEAAGLSLRPIMVKTKSTKQRVTSLSGIRLSSGLHQQLWSRIGIYSRPTFYSRSLLLYLHSQH